MQIKRVASCSSNALGSWMKHVKTWGWILPFAPCSQVYPTLCMGLKSSLFKYSTTTQLFR